MTTDTPTLPAVAIPLVRLTKDAAPRTILSYLGLTMKAQCITDPDDATQTQIVITLATNENGTEYSSTSIYFGNMQTINVADGDVTVLCYSTSMAGTGFFGGISASIAKLSGTALNGTLAIGVETLGADGVVSGTLV
jgi:hypothetical protein